MKKFDVRSLPEWAQQSSILIAWPHRHGDWVNQLESIELFYCQLCHLIAAKQNVIILCFDNQHLHHAGKTLDKYSNQKSINRNNIRLIQVPTNDTWVRDYGPTTIEKKQCKQWIHFKFNAWGDQFTFDLDNQATQSLYRQLSPDFPIQTSPLTCEGGNLQVDGEGTLIANQDCIINTNRNPDKTKKQVESELSTLLGITRFLWIKDTCLKGDDTGGHIDNLVRFSDTDTLLYSSCDAPTHANYIILQRLEDQLKTFKRKTGDRYKLIKLPVPAHPPVLETGTAKTLLPATYTNFLITNHHVIVPAYNVREDLVALQKIQTCFPTRTAVNIDCTRLIQQRGGIHCATLQLYCP